MSVCDIASCPADALVGSRFCGPHKDARTAKELRLGPNKKGLGAATCARCWRKFKDDDYVSRMIVARTVRAKTVSAWQHVACSPARPRPTRKQIRESAKPLLEAGDERGNGEA